MGAVLLAIVGLVLTLTFIILFYSKKRVDNNETNIYSKLLIINTVFIIIGLITFAIAKITNNISLIGIFQKIYMSILIILDYFSIKYCFLISKLKIDKYKLINKILIILTFITILLIFILPLTVVYYDDVLDGWGPSYNVTIIYSIISYLIFIILTFYLILKKESIMKLTPFLVLIMLYLVGFILRNVYQELIFEGFFYSYMLLIMYHTIENPDMKMLRELQLTQSQMKKSNQIKSEFLSSMSHEIRTPLNAIVGYSQLIDCSTTLEEAKENAKDIINSSDVLLNMYQNMLDIYKLESNEITVEKKEYNPNNEFSSLLNMFNYKVIDKKLELISEIDEMPILIGAIDIIKKSIINILDNAIKYTNNGYILFRSSFNEKKELIITIKDTGVGIKKENLDKLFTNFERLEYKDSNVNGMGLGLSLTKNLLELIDGKIEIKSEVGQGTQVKIIVKQDVAK